ncbi:MAG: hypothetical protein IPG89_09435 [Bacteroidetes bacterium]|nr:hypothetical protein [Bacteroidota bacterium]
MPLNIGEPSKAFAVNIDGDNLYSLIGLPLASDSMKNVIKQLGDFKFTTSMDEYYPYPTTAAYLNYEFGSMYICVRGAGMNIERSELQKTYDEYTSSFKTESIVIYPEDYKKPLPYNLKYTDTPSMVEKKVGLHDNFFHTPRETDYKFFYPNKGLEIKFYCGLSDTTITQITLTDSITEMQRFPTKFGADKEK